MLFLQSQDYEGRGLELGARMFVYDFELCS